MITNEKENQCASKLNNAREFVWEAQWQGSTSAKLLARNFRIMCRKCHHDCS